MLLKTAFSLKGNFSKAKMPDKIMVQEIKIAPFKNNAKASVSVSADFELNWAWRGRNEKEVNLRGTRSRRNIPYILKILEIYDVPITWAIVGHLFLRDCNRSTLGMAHPKMPRPTRNNRWQNDWYVHDPCTDFKRDPLWYAPDLIEQIIESKVQHEIGTHSFSHIDFSAECTNRELVRREIEECIAVMEPYGLQPRSLVFPFNKMGYSHMDILSDLGITSVRHRDIKARLSYPERTTSGIYKIYESMNLRSPRYYDYLNKAKIFIGEASRRHAAYHLWFHPSDPTHVFENEFRRIIKYICDERERGAVWIATMGELTAYSEARENVNLQVQRKKNEIKIFIESFLDYKKYSTTEISLIIPVTVFPRKVLLQHEDRIQNLEPEKLFIERNSQRLVINIPVTAKCLLLEMS